jgi:ferric-dicitrate binding protein FerR (iron transport regulator)
MDAEDHPDFLAKFAAGQHTPTEHLAFQRWLQRATPEQVREALNRYEELQRLHLPLPAATATMMALEARLDALTAAAPEQILPLPRRMRWLPAAAAAILVLLVAGAAYFLHASRPLPALAQRHTAAGETARLTLADGSIVQLNSNSTLAYPATSDAKTREVYLQGEAYFEVAKDAAHPFIIHSGRLQTRVVGTSFNVYAYRHASRQEVTVLTGRVVVTDSSSGRAVALRPAQKAVLSAAAPLAVELVADPKLSIAWQQGQLVFEQATLAEITDKLALRYGVTIALAAKRLQACRLTVSFAHESLKEALEIITALTGSTYTQHQQHILLTGSGC